MKTRKGDSTGANRENGHGNQERRFRFIRRQRADTNDGRYERWSQASHGLGRVEVFMVAILQGLGRFDSQLILADNRFGLLSEREWAAKRESFLLTERIMLSYLWVLGAYELVRTLDQRCRAD